MNGPRIVLCCGVGGVGKTTTSAAVAVGHALAGDSVVVLTIDPARRLADALGVERLGNSPVRVPLEAAVPDATGSLHALMLDRKATFDESIRRLAPDPETAERLLENRYYKAVSERLSGSHEYMALEKLYELVHDGTWDVVVVDTPPTQHALDFFRAPERLERIFSRSVLKVLVRPGRGLISATTRSVAQLIMRMAGENVMEDIAEFFRLVAGLSEGFLARSKAVRDLLTSDRALCYLVTAASSPTRTDALQFLGTMGDHGIGFGGFLVNRVCRDPGFDPPLARTHLPARPAHFDEDEWDEIIDALLALGERSTRRAVRHAARISTLTDQGRDAPVWMVPNVPGGVRSLEGLAGIATYLPPNAPSLQPGEVRTARPARGRARLA